MRYTTYNSDRTTTVIVFVQCWIEPGFILLGSKFTHKVTK